MVDLGNSYPGIFTDDRAIIVHPPTAGPGSTLCYEVEFAVSEFP